MKLILFNVILIFFNLTHVIQYEFFNFIVKWDLSRRFG